jgi:hypothetical protein
MGSGGMRLGSVPIFYRSLMRRMRSSADLGAPMPAGPVPFKAFMREAAQ